MPMYVSDKDANAPMGALLHSIICHEHKSINNRNLCSNRNAGAINGNGQASTAETIYIYVLQKIPEPS